MSRSDWSVRVVKNSVDSYLQIMWFNSSALEMTTAEHCMYLTKFCEFLVCWCMWYSSGEFNHNKELNKATTSLKSTRAGAFIIQILQELEQEPALLKIKRTGRVSNRIINTVIVHMYR